MAGVPQAPVLGPTLYNIYSSDIPRPWNEKINITMFADDLLIKSSHKYLKYHKSKLIYI